jgi:hypothetical protein
MNRVDASLRREPEVIRPSSNRVYIESLNARADALRCGRIIARCELTSHWPIVLLRNLSEAGRSLVRLRCTRWTGEQNAGMR